MHLATEGPLGWAARRWLGKRGLDFTSAIHTRFPEYLRDRCPWLPLSWGYAFLRAFHRPSRAVLVSTPRLRDEFCAWRFQHLRLWRKGVDTELFHPAETPAAEERPPVFLYVGRLATEKNLEAFLDLELPGENGWWATARSGRRWSSAIHRRVFSATAMAAHWPTPTGRPRCWCFPR
ncbi:hypothetical protein BANRA_04972 [Pseudomonas aeruginosa]|nr:hypothetical protein BANRA_04972 [Pseudomonas aeruginosa]